MTTGFTFKQFHVDHQDCGMPVSTDGVLLGSWAQLQPQGPILDLGTGSGLLALMAAQRSENTLIDAIDIDHHACHAAKRNFEQSPWAHRLTSHHCSVQEWITQTPAQHYATILCNPPYFNHGQQAESTQRAIARHTSTLTQSDLLNAIDHALSPDGVANLILPCFEGEQLLMLTKQHHLYLQTLCEVHSTENKGAQRYLMTLGRSPQWPVRSRLNIHEQGQYSNDFIALTQAFYLKF